MSAPQGSDPTVSPTPLSHHLAPGYSSPILREWHALQATITPSNFVFPMFLLEGDPNQKREISALPNQYHFGIQSAVDYVRPLVEKLGLKAVLLFGVPDPERKKDGRGSLADDANGPVIQGIKLLRKHFSSQQLLIVTDVCLCAYTDSGHCGILRPDGLGCDNQRSTKRLAEIAVAYARAGADVVAPSDMMDSRIAAIKQALRVSNMSYVPVMSYSAKFASGLYGPFRSACATNLKGDRRCYQLPPSSDMLAERAIRRDLAEGADFIMIKPGSFYLDIIRKAKEIAPCPIAVYHVSGEYAMLWHAAKANALNLKDVVLEQMVAFRRAGADLIITYYTPVILEWLQNATNPHPVTPAITLQSRL